MTMMSLTQKAATARRILRTRGMRGVASVVAAEKFPGPLWRAFYGWLRRNNWWVGRFIELTGDKVKIDGCTFSVRNPAIPTRLKSRFLFNQYEPSERQALREFLDPALPVVEFGGSVGVVACLTNRRLKDPTRHVVVEANPALVPLLEENRERNGCRFTVLHRAVAYGAEQVTFHQDDDFLGSSVQGTSGREVTVPAVTLSEVVERFGFDRLTLICDIEGGEVELVERDARVFRERVETIIIEVHEAVAGAEPIARMLRDLEAMGFETVFKDWDTYTLSKRGAARA